MQANKFDKWKLDCYICQIQSWAGVNNLIVDLGLLIGGGFGFFSAVNLASLLLRSYKLQMYFQKQNTIHLSWIRFQNYAMLKTTFFGKKTRI